MCGIFVSTGDKRDIGAALARLSHRGPDHMGTVREGDVALGHCRLSIIDVSDDGDQPMVSSSGKSAIVFNGEIYNYCELRTELSAAGAKFRTNSDTEVILAGYELYGTGFFEKLRGMWAFVIHDRQTSMLIAARDPFGIKPLFYVQHTDKIYFTSELRALKGFVPLEPDPNAYRLYYSLGYFLAPDTPFKGVSKAAPGEVLQWNLKLKNLSRITRTSRFMGTTHEVASYEECVEHLDQVLTDSVSAHYVADVPVSMLLSGGNDSSLIAALSKKIGKTPVAYHIAMPDSEDTTYARAIAAHLGMHLEIEELSHRALEDGYRALDDLLDEPTGDTSIIPTAAVYEKIKGRAKVVLSGEGGDELFGGYLRHASLLKHSQISSERTMYALLDELLFANSKGVRLWNPIVQKARRALLSSGVLDDLIEAYIAGTSIIDFPVHKQILRERLYQLYEQDKDPQTQKALALDLFSYLPNDLLPKSDIASMASSIEARVPFVDRLVAQEVGPILKRYPAMMEEKRIVKDVLLRYLPNHLVYRAKKGFGVPFHKYEATSLRKDLDAACSFFLSASSAYGIDAPLAALLYEANARDAVLRKFPRFAFALVTAWKFNLRV